MRMRTCRWLENPDAISIMLSMDITADQAVALCPAGLGGGQQKGQE